MKHIYQKRKPLSVSSYMKILSYNVNQNLKSNIFKTVPRKIVMTEKDDTAREYTVTMGGIR